MNSHPLILTAAEVRAVLSGTKTQHRVRVKPQPVQVERYLHGQPTDLTDAKGTVMRGPDGKGWACCGPFRCPFGEPGDLLWVREAWAAPVVYNLASPAAIPPWAGAWWRADSARPLSESELRWRSPLSMPRWASRLTLAVESVRVQRVQGISEEDARAEGVTPFPRDPEGDCWTDGTHRTAFNYAWNAKYGSRAWDRNDWVFALTFKRVQP